MAWLALGLKEFSVSLFGEQGMPGAKLPVDAMLIARNRGEKTPTNVSIFKCERTNRMVACNSLARPFSPYASSSTMKRVSSGTTPVTAAEVKAETIRLATCQQCESRLHAFPTVIRAAALNPNFKDVLCILCGTKVPVRADLQGLYGEQGSQINEAGQVLMKNGEIAPEYTNNNGQLEGGGDNADLMPTEVNFDGAASGQAQMRALAGDDDNDDNDDNDEGSGGESAEMTNDDNGEDSQGEAAETSDSANSDSDSENSSDGDSDGMDGQLGDGDDVSAALASTSHHRRRQAALAGEEASEETEGNEGVADHLENSDGGGESGAVSSTVTSSTKMTVTAFDVLDTTALNNYGVLQLDGENAAVFVTTANGHQPLLLLEAKHASANNRSLFAKSDLLANAFGAVISTPGFKMSAEALREFGAKAFSLDITAGDFIAKRIATGVGDAHAALASEKNSLVATMRQCLSIAGLEVLKNLNAAAPNPVRMALVESLTQNGVRDAGKLVDLAFAKEGDNLLKTIIAKAVALSAKPLEVRNELAAVFATAATQQPHMQMEANEAAQADKVAQDLAAGSMAVAASARENDFSTEAGVAPAGNPKMQALVRGALSATRHRH